MIAALSFAAIDSSYLTWRYLAMRLGMVAPGTSICSWTKWIDCDRVLLTPAANAFYVPNALLGSAFYIGCLLWWFLGKRLGEEYRSHIVRTLAFWLGVATLFTLRFFWLLFHLTVFCPLCPLNHIATYIALGAAVAVFRATRPHAGALSVRRLFALVMLCVGFFVAMQVMWFLAEVNGVLRLPA